MRVATVVILVACVVVCLLATASTVAPVYAAGPKHGGGPNRSEVEGRKHARKANQLADVNKCKAAIPEYTKAIHLLKDPTLLFNRGECYRRTGDAKKAIADYRKFLTQLPSAPNRAVVESQIAALENKKGAPAVVTAAPAINLPIARVPPVEHVAPPKLPRAAAPAAGRDPTAGSGGRGASPRPAAGPRTRARLGAVSPRAAPRARAGRNVGTDGDRQHQTRGEPDSE